MVPLANAKQQHISTDDETAPVVHKRAMGEETVQGRTAQQCAVDERQSTYRTAKDGNGGNDRAKDAKQLKLHNTTNAMYQTGRRRERREKQLKQTQRRNDTFLLCTGPNRVGGWAEEGTGPM